MVDTVKLELRINSEMRAGTEIRTFITLILDSKEVTRSW